MGKRQRPGNRPSTVRSRAGSPWEAQLEEAEASSGEAAACSVEIPADLGGAMAGHSGVSVAVEEARQVEMTVGFVGAMVA